MTESVPDPLTSSISRDALPDLSESMVLLDQARGGDRAALSDLLARYQERLHRIVRIRLGTHLRGCFDSMDIVQNTNVVAYQRLADGEVTSTAGILKWLTHIAQNQIRDLNDYLHAQKRDKRREVPLGGRGDGSASSPGAELEPPASVTLPDDRAERDELARLVDDAVAELEPDDREVILLRDYYGGSWRFVADEMGRASVDGTRKLHERAMMRLRCKVRARRLDADGETIAVA